MTDKNSINKSGEDAGAPKIRMRAIADLKKNPRNTRTHSAEQIQKLAAAIREFGFLGVIVLDGADCILAGHGRLDGAELAGLKEVPTIDAGHLTEAQKRAYMIADNRISDEAGWNFEQLKIELGDLALANFDLKLTGFDQDEIDDFLAPKNSGNGKENEIPPLEATAISKAGEIWILGMHRLAVGDSTSAATMRELMGGERADMVFTDPPYGVDYEGINNDDRAGLSKLLAAAFERIKEFTKPGSGVYVFHSDRCADIFHTAFRNFFHFSSMIIWEKESLVLSQTDYQSIHEPCMYGWLAGAPHQFHGDRKQTSVWKFPAKKVEGHTTPKPIGLIEKALENSSKGNQIVLDPFGGSGSTLIACEKSGRRARLIEIDPLYCDLIIRRWEEFSGKKATREGDGAYFQNLKPEEAAA